MPKLLKEIESPTPGQSVEKALQKIMMAIGSYSDKETLRTVVRLDLTTLQCESNLTGYSAGVRTGARLRESNHLNPGYE